MALIVWAAISPKAAGKILESIKDVTLNAFGG